MNSKIEFDRDFLTNYRLNDPLNLYQQIEPRKFYFSRICGKREAGSRKLEERT
jgi:hypothetical protein